MTECTACNGSGRCYDGYEDIFRECDRCHGSGEIKSITNEEWFASLSTEEKAKWLSRHSQFMYECGEEQTIPKTMYEEDWEWWLKEVHNA